MLITALACFNECSDLCNSTRNISDKRNGVSENVLFAIAFVFTNLKFALLERDLNPLLQIQLTLLQRNDAVQIINSDSHSIDGRFK